MFDLESVKGIVKALEWISTLGKSEIKDFKNEVNELISELSKSLTNLWDVVEQVTIIKDDDFSKGSFEAVNDYFFRFYAGNWNISPARTHCGNVERSVERIKFKVSKLLHSNLGRWNEVDKKLELIVERDGDILREYDESIHKIEAELNIISRLINENEIESAKKQYLEIKNTLKPDIRLLRDGIKKMEEAINHINRICG